MDWMNLSGLVGFLLPLLPDAHGSLGATRLPSTGAVDASTRSNRPWWGPWLHRGSTNAGGPCGGPAPPGSLCALLWGTRCLLARCPRGICPTSHLLCPQSLAHGGASCFRSKSRGRRDEQARSMQVLRAGRLPAEGEGEDETVPPAPSPGLCPVPSVTSAGGRARPSSPSAEFQATSGGSQPRPLQRARLPPEPAAARVRCPRQARKREGRRNPDLREVWGEFFKCGSQAWAGSLRWWPCRGRLPRPRAGTTTAAGSSVAPFPTLRPHPRCPSRSILAKRACRAHLQTCSGRSVPSGLLPCGDAHLPEVLIWKRG